MGAQVVGVQPPDESRPAHQVLQRDVLRKVRA
jgi:hypothetical protein